MERFPQLFYPMNVFILSSAIEIYSYQLAQGLAKKDNVCIGMRDIAGMKLISDFPEFVLSSKVKNTLIPHFSFPDPRAVLQGFRLYKKIRQHQTDVLHFHMGNFFSEHLIALLLADRKNIPIVATVHDTVPHTGDHMAKYKHYISYLLTKIGDHAIVHGKAQVKDIEKLGFQRDAVSIVPHGNYDIYLQAANAGDAKKPEPSRVLLFGRMIKYKGLDILIKAAPLIAQEVPNLTIVLAGRGPELDRLTPEIHNNSLFEIHNRFIEPAEVQSFFTRASVIVLPYLNATQSGPLHLAYTCGRPVVATEVGAIPEAMTDGVEGLFVPPNNPAALAKAIVDLLKSTDTALNMGKAGRNRASRDLNWDGDIAEKTRSAYLRAIEHRKRAGKHDRPTFKQYMQRMRAIEREKACSSRD